MIKKKAKKTGKAGKKSAKKTSIEGMKMDPAKVRDEIVGLVKAGAPEIAQAVISGATLGDLARARYLFEMAGIFPKPAEGEQATEEEDCLAKTLLARLDAVKKVSEEEPKPGQPEEAAKENEPSVETPVEPVVVS